MISSQPRPSAASSKSSAAAAALAVELTGEAAAAEQVLRAWRTQRARTDGVPPYIVLSDRTLKAIATARPATARALIQCDGIGPAKLEKYGDEILDLMSGLAALAD